MQYNTGISAVRVQYLSKPFVLLLALIGHFLIFTIYSHVTVKIYQYLPNPIMAAKRYWIPVHNQLIPLLELYITIQW